MLEKLKEPEPVLKFEPLPPVWVSAPLKDASNSLSGSSDHLPDGVYEVKEQPFTAPRFQRGEGHTAVTRTPTIPWCRLHKNRRKFFKIIIIVASFNLRINNSQD